MYDELLHTLSAADPPTALSTLLLSDGSAMEERPRGCYFHPMPCHPTPLYPFWLWSFLYRLQLRAPSFLFLSSVLILSLSFIVVSEETGCYTENAAKIYLTN